MRLGSTERPRANSTREFAAAAGSRIVKSRPLRAATPPSSEEAACGKLEVPSFDASRATCRHFYGREISANSLADGSTWRDSKKKSIEFASFFSLFSFFSYYREHRCIMSRISVASNTR